MAGQQEPGFVSGVVYISEQEAKGRANDTAAFLGALARQLADGFAYAEVVAVFDCGSSDVPPSLVAAMPANATLLFMGKEQGLEAAMNAGIDAAVGDFVLEVDDIGSYDGSFLSEAFELVKAGTDIVFGESPDQSLQGKVFYPLFNRFSASQENLSTGPCRLASRRAVNRVHSMSSFMPYRKAAYASSGLATGAVKVSSSRRGSRSGIGLAIDSIALYTDFFFKASIGIAVGMTALSLAELIYVIVILIAGNPVTGWVTTMVVLTVGFLGLFVLLSFALKYLDLLVKSSFNKKRYLIEEIRKP